MEQPHSARVGQRRIRARGRAEVEGERRPGVVCIREREVAGDLLTAESQTAPVLAVGADVGLLTKAADTLAEQGIGCDVIDPRTTSPLDEEAILDSVEQTGRLVVVDECPPRCSVASEVISVVAEKGMELLRAPPVRVNRLAVHVPSNQELEDFLGPNTGRIVEAVKAVCARSR